jgi:16S rRNA (cytosine967-C5)-methyltransferase
MRVTPARRIAFEVLRRVELGGAYAADLLHARLRGPVKREDAALATELTLGVLRWQRLLDFLLERHLSQPAGSLDFEVLLALRIGLYQLRCLSRVPARAAVNESVELAKWAKKSSAARLVNAVLRRAAEKREKPAEQFVPADLSPADRLGILHSHPTWMVSRWLALFGRTRTVALLEANNRPHRVVCIVRDEDRVAQVAQSLSKASLRVEPGRLLRSALAVRGGDPAKTEAFRHGWIAFQSEASHGVALLVDVRPGQSVLDLCAAPGGKTSVLARAAGLGPLVVAADNHLHRLRAMREHLQRTGAAHARLVALEATVPLPFGTRFDRILVDAPCSGTGTLAANPEIRWRLRPEDLQDFHRRQVKLLSHALERLAPGGRLVYSTCSLEPEENEQVVSEATRAGRDVRGVSGAGALAPHLRENVDPAPLFGTDNCFRTFPPEQDTDGFFAAVFERALNG